MAEKVRRYYQNQNPPDCIIPVPLHPLRLKQRGFNQALEIARPIAKKLKIPIDTTHCLRIVATLPQAAISATARKHNIKNAFIVNPLLKAKHVAIVDDVLTTGSTVTELAQRLKKSGVQKIDIWCCARPSFGPYFLSA
jgi:ComF family protein